MSCTCKLIKLVKLVVFISKTRDQYPKEELGHAGLPHHRLKTPPCQGLGIAAPKPCQKALTQIKNRAFKGNPCYIITEYRDYMKERYAAISKWAYKIEKTLKRINKAPSLNHENCENKKKTTKLKGFCIKVENQLPKLPTFQFPYILFKDMCRCLIKINLIEYS